MSDSSAPPSAWQAWLAPRARQAWLNLRVWVPGLANPDLRARTVTLGSREARQGQTWDVELPEQCWSCGEREGLRRRAYDLAVRGFEFPLGIAAGALATSAIWFVWLVVWPGRLPLVLLLGTLLLGAAGVFIKSWVDEVSLGAWHCPRHLEAPPVEFVLEENQLHVVLPSTRLAEALAESVQQRRRSRRAYADDSAPPPPSGRDSRPHTEHPLPQSYHRATPDLPPIELADGPEDTPRADEPTQEE